ncbi:MAG: sigma-70 family RNA polymerase sigma factor [Chitinophagaceae bacterium]
MENTGNVNQLVAHLFRHESGKMVAVLSRLLGLNHVDIAQDIVQDTLLQAMSTWSFGNIPDNPPAWLYRVAQNKAIDYLRREKKFKEISPQYAYLLQSEYTLTPTVVNLFLETEMQDSQLRMIFACCHPSIPEDSQIAFVLKTLCGLSVSEIAKAYLTSEETIAKRIYRAKGNIKSGGINLEVPQGDELPGRLDVVLKSLYLLFNEGYNSSNPDFLIRDDLCAEALRLCYLLSEHSLTNLSRTRALMALLCFQSSRLQARLDDKGKIILLKFQDRTKWKRELIQRGFHYIDSATDGKDISKYHFEAAIASIHAAALSFEQTDWKSIYHLYETLYQLDPGPIIALNKAIASAYAISRENALKELMEIKGLEQYYLYYASAGEMYLDLNKKEEAKSCFEKAMRLTSSISEQQLLLEKISQCN